MVPALRLSSIHVLLRVGQPRPHASDVLLHLLGGRRRAVFERAVLLLDAGPLVREADGVSAVEDRDGWLDEVGVHEVLDNLADHGKRDGAALLLGELGDGRGDLLEVGAHVVGLHHHDARGRRGVVKDGDARGVCYHGTEPGLGGGALLAHYLGLRLSVDAGWSLSNEGVEGVCHGCFFRPRACFSLHFTVFNKFPSNGENLRNVSSTGEKLLTNDESVLITCWNIVCKRMKR